MPALSFQILATFVLFLLSGCLDFYAPRGGRPAQMATFEGELPSTVSGAGWVVSDSEDGAIFADPQGVIAAFPSALGEANHTVLSDRSILVWTPDSLWVFGGEQWEVFRAHTLAGLPRAAISNVAALRSNNIAVDLIDLDSAANRHIVCGLRGACVAWDGTDGQGSVGATTNLIWTVSGSRVLTRRPSEDRIAQSVDLPGSSIATYALIGDRFAVRVASDLYLIQGFSTAGPVRISIPNDARQYLPNAPTWGTSDLHVSNGRLLKARLDTTYRRECSGAQWGFGVVCNSVYAWQNLVVSEVRGGGWIEIGHAALNDLGGWQITMSTYGTDTVVTTGYQPEPWEVWVARPLRFVVPRLMP